MFDDFIDREPWEIRLARYNANHSLDPMERSRARSIVEQYERLQRSEQHQENNNVRSLLTV